MKKIVASVGLVAIGASALQTANAQSLAGGDTSKPWSVSATLRGFYDDNTSTLPNDFSVPAGQHRDSFGYEVSPSAALVWSMGQTTANLGVLYSFRYFENVPLNSTDHSDHVFTINGGLTHAFNENVRVRVSDSFVIGQEPDLLRAGNTAATFQRVDGDNIRNYGSIALDNQLTPVFGVNVGYDNAYYNYDSEGFDFVNFQPSLSGALDRIEHRAHLEGTYQLQPETRTLVGYQFGETDYTADELIGLNAFGSVFSEDRNSRQHTGYVGVEHNFSRELVATIRAGASYSDYYNTPDDDSTWTPYLNATLKYTYAPESFVQGGFSYDRSATDVVGFGGASAYTLDSESAVVFASVKHQIMPNLFGSVLGQFQNSEYRGGQFDGETEQYYTAGIDLEYRINQYFSTHVGYNYDRLESDLGRTFDRNRVYVGVTATY